MRVGIEELVAYWLGELSVEREAAIEEAVFSDARLGRRLDSVAQFEAGLRELIAAGRLQSSIGLIGLESLTKAGLQLREYRVGPGQTVPCTIADEDLVVIRLQGDFSAAEVDVVMHGDFAGLPSASEAYSAVPVAGGEVILVYPGDRIRALPRSHFRYEVRGAGDDEGVGESLGSFALDHSPRA